jgi:predicted Ser/Thr protein kinase
VGADAGIGQAVSGYRIVRLLGRGGMGAVYLAVDEQLDRQVALKLLLPELSEDESFRERFLRESRLAAGLEHPNVVPIYQAGNADGTLFIAMRYVDGTDLKRLLADVGPLGAHTLASIAAQVASALDAAHRRGLVHRDVKPANVLLGADEHAYLSDFGLTKQSASQSGLTATGQLVGTLDYVAPEQVQGQQVDGRADVYSLACLLHECSTGRPPFRRDTDVATLWAQIQDAPPSTGNPVVDAVLARGLAKDRDDRYPTAAELADDLRRALGVSSGEIPQLQTRPRRSNRRLIGAALGVLAAAVVGGVLLLHGGGAKGLAAVPPRSVGLIDPSSGKIVAAIPVGPSPTRAAIGAGAVWVASNGDGTLLRIDARTHRIVKTIGLGFNPTDIAAAPHNVYLSDPARVSVVRVDADSNLVSESTRIAKLGGANTGPAAAPAHIVVGAGSVWGDTGFSHTSVVRVQTPADTVHTVDLGSHTADALAYATGALWIADFSNGVVVRVSPARNAVTATVPLGTGAEAPFATALGAGATGVWAVGVPPESGGGSYAPAYSRPATVFRIDPRLGGVIASVPVGHQSSGGTRTGYGGEATDTVAVGPGAVWVANGGDGTLSEIDPARNIVVKTIEVGPGVDGVALGDGYVWVSRP